MNHVTTAVQIVRPQYCNGMSRARLFGGQLMSWIDTIATVAARRYAQCEVTTLCVDNLTFMEPAYANDTVVQKAQVTWTGHTSMEVRVDSYVEQLSGKRQLINRAYLVFVALDDGERPTAVPPFEPDTEEEKRELEAALKRREIRLKRPTE